MRWILSAILLVSGTAACAGVAGEGRGAAAHPEARSTLGAGGLEVLGRVDWSWELSDVDARRPGGDFTLAELRGRPIFINVWATWCPPCVAELESIDALRRSMEGSDVAFLLVSPEERGIVRDFLRRRGWELPTAVERTRMPDAFGLEALPTTFIVDRAGRIVLRHRGATDWNRDSVRELLAFLEGT